MNTNPLVLNNGIPITLPLSGSSAFVSYASSQVTTTSSTVTSGSFTTFSNSPAFTFTPTISGTYKVYASVPVINSGASTLGVIRIFNTSGSATLLNESQAESYQQVVGVTDTIYIQSVYTLTAGNSYQFDIQGLITSGSSIEMSGSNAPFYMFAEGIGLTTSSPTGSYAQAYFDGAVSTWSTTSNSYVDGTNSGGNALNIRQDTIGLTAAASNVCGITFTPASASAVYQISASVGVYNSVVGGSTSLQLIDSNSLIISQPPTWEQSGGASDAVGTVPINGIYVPGTASPVTVRIQLAAFLGTGQIACQFNSNLGNSVEWTIVRIA